MVHDTVHKSVQRCKGGDESLGLLLLRRNLCSVSNGNRYSSDFNGVGFTLGRDGRYHHCASKLRVITQQEDRY
jgi:hypothetical protein